MTAALHDFDTWLRTEFVSINTHLEACAGGDATAERAQLADRLLSSGRARLERLAADHWLPERASERYALLGMIGYYLAACHRHGAAAQIPAALSDAEQMAGRLGSSLGVAPRCVFAHQALYNTAIAGAYRTFTALPAERTFLELNARGVLAYRRAARSLGDIAEIGVSSPLASELLDEARRALDDVLLLHQTLGRSVTPAEFTASIRPYFLSHPIGGREYRGMNAGDFSAINEIDVALGAARIDDPNYLAIVVEKAPYVPPEDQPALRALATRRSLLAAFLTEAHAMPSRALANNARRFLAVWRAHGAAAAYHHHRLVLPYLGSAAHAAPDGAPGAASGPPLAHVLAALARLVDLRIARARPGLPSAHVELAELRRFAASSPDFSAEASPSLAATPPA